MKCKNIFISNLFYLLTFLFLSTRTSSAIAQKLPVVQTDALIIPNIMVDGKSTDWPKDFKAYNKNVDLYYSIANNDKYLFLIIRATDQLMIKKILLGGVTFSITPDKKEINSSSKSISFPVYQAGGDFKLDFDGENSMQKDRGQKSLFQDSLNTIINQRFKGMSKEMEVYGFKEIKDTLISVYNEFGIKAAATFDGQNSYTYELGIPLKYLGDAVQPGQMLNYNIKLIGYHELKIPKGGQRPPPPPPFEPSDQVLYSPTDFWAEYKIQP